MGAGKSFLGKQLSESLGIPFIDSDNSIENQEGNSISEIFQTKGEAYFRTKEKEFIQNISITNEYVLACGGGLPCFNELMEKLNELGTTVYLRNSNATLLNRLILEKNKRPLIADLTEEEIEKTISEKISEREKYYLKADIVLEEADQSIVKIIQALHLHQKN